MKIDRQKIMLFGGIVMAIAAMVMAKVYMDQQQLEVKKRAEEKIKAMQASQATVLVAKVDIPFGSVIGPDSFEVSIIPNKYVAPQAVSSLDRIAGMVTTATISKGEQITLSKLTYPGGLRGGLAGVTPVGKRAISMPADNLASLSGMVRPGDYVDVLAIIPVPQTGADGKQVMESRVIPLFQNVLVLAIGQEITVPSAKQDEEAGSRYKTDTSQAPAGGATPLITLALSPQETSLIAFVQEQGKIRLAMRNPTDTRTEFAMPTGWETLFSYVLPTQASAPTPEEPAPPEGYVEIYRGLNKEKQPLYK